VVEKAPCQEGFADVGMPAEKWAKGVVQDLLRENPPKIVWRGDEAWLVMIASVSRLGCLIELSRR